MLQHDLEKNGIVRSTVEGVAEKSRRNSGKLLSSRKQDRQVRNMGNMVRLCGGADNQGTEGKASATDGEPKAIERRDASNPRFGEKCAPLAKIDGRSGKKW